MYYFDYSATTKTNKEVLNEFNYVSDKYFANINSTHSLSTDAKKYIDEKIEIIADYFNVLKNEIIFTSGATESNNLAIKGLAQCTSKKHIITTKFEHSSIISVMSYMQTLGYKVDFVDVDKNGVVDLNSLKSLINDDTFLVSICAVDSELGIKQPIEEIGLILRDYDDIYFHSDITQALGKIKINLENIDLASFSAHKIYAPKGIGGLIKKNTVRLSSQINGGKSLSVYRSGTPQNELIASVSKAIELISQNEMDKYNHVLKLNEFIKNEIKDLGKINSTENSIPHILNISLNDIPKIYIQDYLSKNDIYVSLNTACTLNNDYSKTVYDLYNDMQRAKSSFRISLSYLTTMDEVRYLVDKLRGLVNENN